MCTETAVLHHVKFSSRFEETSKELFMANEQNVPTAALFLYTYSSTHTHTHKSSHVIFLFASRPSNGLSAQTAVPHIIAP